MVDRTWDVEMVPVRPSRFFFFLLIAPIKELNSILPPCFFTNFFTTGVKRSRFSLDLILTSSCVAWQSFKSSLVQFFSAIGDTRARVSSWHCCFPFRFCVWLPSSTSSLYALTDTVAVGSASTESWSGCWAGSWPAPWLLGLLLSTCTQYTSCPRLHASHATWNVLQQPSPPQTLIIDMFTFFTHNLKNACSTSLTTYRDLWQANRVASNSVATTVDQGPNQACRTLVQFCSIA